MKTFMLSLVFLVGVSFSGIAKESNQVNAENNKTVQVNAENSKTVNVNQEVNSYFTDCGQKAADAFNWYYRDDLDNYQKARDYADLVYNTCKSLEQFKKKHGM